MNLEQYLPVLLFILVGTGVGILPQVLGRLLGPVRPDSEKNSPYECGFEAFEDARMKFDVRYYLVAILFILFDLELLSFFHGLLRSRKSVRWVFGLSWFSWAFWSLALSTSGKRVRWTGNRKPSERGFSIKVRVCR